MLGRSTHALENSLVDSNRALDEAQPRNAATGFLPVETVRAVAIIILVSFHVIGGPDGRGLGLPATHPLRLYADLLVDLRMPLFAFVSGLVYAFRPVLPKHLGSFFRGKLRRLVIPGAVAMTLFAAAAVATGAVSQPPDPIWMMYFKGYSIFWFLQAILLIFIFVGIIDSISRGKLLLPMLIGASLALCFGLTFSSEIMSADHVTSLLPYFLLGVLVVRKKDFLLDNKVTILLIGVAAMIVGLIMNLSVLAETGAFSEERLDLQSFLFGSGACIAAILALPSIRSLRWLGAYSFTIYLYHIFATSGSRKLLMSLGIESPYTHFLIGTALGIALPASLHLIASRATLSRQILLGLRPLPSSSFSRTSAV